MRDYFADLGLSPDASLEEIRKAYKQLARLFHPDVAPDRAEEFATIQEAYDQLKSQTRIEKIRKKIGTNSRNENRLVAYDRWSPKSSTRANALKATNPESPARVEKLDQRIIVIVDLGKRSGQSQEVQWSVEEVCAHCRGSGGSSRSKRVRCKSCAGLGYKMISRGASFRWKKTCEECHGQGAQVEEACKDCQAYGKTVRLQKRSFVIPKDLSKLEVYEALGHESFDSKTRGRLYIQWLKRED